MTVNDLMVKLDANAVAACNLNRKVNAFYAGDFLSYVMGRAPKNCAWFTVMNNVNVAGVASLANVSVVVLCDGTSPDQLLLTRANENGINIIVTKMPIYEACINAK